VFCCPDLSFYVIAFCPYDPHFCFIHSMASGHSFFELDELDDLVDLEAMEELRRMEQQREFMEDIDFFTMVDEFFGFPVMPRRVLRDRCNVLEYYAAPEFRRLFGMEKV